MLILVFTLQGDTLYNYYYSQALDPSKLYYKTLVKDSNDLTNVYKLTNIFYYLENEIQPNFFPNKTLKELTNIWVGPMQFRQVD